MRNLFIAAAAIAAGGLLALAPAKAGSSDFNDVGNQHAGAPKSAPTYDDCFRLAWVRGVHVERFEFASFDAECVAGRVPFDSGYAASTVKRQSK
jgi:hypothetical protein